MNKVCPESPGMIATNTIITSTRSQSSPASYESSRIGLTSFSPPIIDQNANLKHRIASVEDSVRLQLYTNEAVDVQLNGLITSSHNLNTKITGDVGDLRSTIQEELLWMRKEFKHKFELQAAENSRLENQILQLKKDNKDLLGKLKTTEERVLRLEKEVLDDDIPPSIEGGHQSHQ